MSRLRIRVELSRGGVGIPLHKLASVVGELQSFLNLLSEDLGIDRQKGEWLGFDFDSESLQFTAEYVGLVTAAQVQEFNAAFDGTTPLRRDTISQFVRITDVIGEEELVGFGLYLSEDAAEPGEWRCLSRRDALRISEGIQLLLAADQAPHLPAVRDPNLEARVFGDQRDRSVQGKWAEAARQVETRLEGRIQRVEEQAAQHAESIQELQNQTGDLQNQTGELQSQSAAAEQSFRNLLASVETFCQQAARSIEQVSPAALPAAAAEGGRSKWSRGRMAGLGLGAAAVLIAVLWFSLEPHGSKSAEASSHGEVAVSQVQAPDGNAVAAPAVSPNAAPPQFSSTAEQPAAPAKPLVQSAASVQPTSASQPTSGRAMRIELSATESAWVTMADGDGKKLLSELLVPGTARTFDVDKSATLLVGNAGGLAVRLNGSSIGSLGEHGQVREVAFKDGGFKVTTPK